MNNAFRRSQAALNHIQRNIREKLEQIQQLDMQCVRLEIMLQELRQSYLEYLTQENAENSPEKIIQENQKIQDISKLEEELRELCNKKVKLAEEIQKIASKTCDSVEKDLCETAQQCLGGSNLKQQVRAQHMFESGTKRYKTRQRHINPEIKTIIKEYYNQKDSEFTQNSFENKKYCFCKPEARLLFSGSMIECQNPKCKVGWFHFECVGISVDSVPTSWYCPKCKDEGTKNAKKAFFNIEDQKVEKEIKLEESQPISQKRSRGRPKKYIDV